MRLMLISFLHPTEPFREHHHGAGGLAAMQVFRACFEVRRPTTSRTQTSLSGFRWLAPHTAGLVQASPPRRKNPGPRHKPEVFTARGVSRFSSLRMSSRLGSATSMRRKSKSARGSIRKSNSSSTRSMKAAPGCVRMAASQARLPPTNRPCGRGRTSLYGAGKELVQLVDGVQSLTNLLEWAAKSGVQTVETLGKIANLARPTSCRRAVRRRWRYRRHQRV
jgi:hypothetical protein